MKSDIVISDFNAMIPKIFFHDLPVCYLRAVIKCIVLTSLFSCILFNYFVSLKNQFIAVICYLAIAYYLVHDYPTEYISNDINNCMLQKN